MGRVSAFILAVIIGIIIMYLFKTFFAGVAFVIKIAIAVIIALFIGFIFSSLKK